MCRFCEGGEVIIREYTIAGNEKIKASISIENEIQDYLLYFRMGGYGYSLPIMANYCMFCGKKLLGGFL